MAPETSRTPLARRIKISRQSHSLLPYFLCRRLDKQQTQYSTRLLLEKCRTVMLHLRWLLWSGETLRCVPARVAGRSYQCPTSVPANWQNAARNLLPGNRKYSLDSRTGKNAVIISFARWKPGADRSAPAPPMKAHCARSFRMENGLTNTPRPKCSTSLIPQPTARVVVASRLCQARAITGL